MGYNIRESEYFIYLYFKLFGLIPTQIYAVQIYSTFVVSVAQTTLLFFFAIRRKDRWDFGPLKPGKFGLIRWKIYQVNDGLSVCYNPWYSTFSSEISPALTHLTRSLLGDDP